MFKKILLITLSLLIAVGCFFMVGCGGNNNTNTEDPNTPLGEIEKSEFLYPEKNDDFRYNKYTYYVAITQCLSLKGNIIIPDTIDNLPVYVIAEKAFANQQTIKSVSISNNVVKIGSSAFQNCSQLASLKLPNNLQVIGENAFNGCSALRDVEIPNTLAIIPSYLFANCESLSYVIVNEPELLSVDPDTGVENYTPARTISNGAFSNCPNLKYIWFSSDCSFGDGGNNVGNPLSGSIENLTIYGYSQSDAAKYAADNFIDFVLIQSKTQLLDFKSAARTAAQVQTVKKDEEMKGEVLNVQIENIYMVRNKLEYYVINENTNRELVRNDLEYTPDVNSVIAVFGVKVKNNTSRSISFNALSANIEIDGYAGRFASFGTLKNNTIDKYSSPCYVQIQAGETRYIYFASIINNDWEEIVINFGNYSELLNYNFTINKDDNIIYIGSPEASIEDPFDQPPVQTATPGDAATGIDAKPEPTSEPASEPATDPVSEPRIVVTLTDVPVDT